MSNINPLNFGVQGNPYLKKDTQDDLAKETLSQPKKEQDVKQANSNELLGYMAAVNSDIIPQKVTRTVEVKKYVNDEQAARIEDFMKGFEADFDEISNSAMSEFPELSQKAADDMIKDFIPLFEQLLINYY